LISRVADHCFWLGRYLERTESTARVLAVNSQLALDAELTPEQCWLPVIIVAGEREAFTAKHENGSIAWSETVPQYMTWDEHNLTSLRSSIGSARENARSIREVLSLEAWETINELHLWFTGPSARAEHEKDDYAFYRHIRRQVQLCLGLLRSTMLHDTPLDFIWLGVLLERVGQTARVLDVHHHAFTHLVNRQEVVETALWLSLLRACSGFEAFMKRNQGKVTGDRVAAFLIFERDFPRSLLYCLEASHDRFEHIRPADQPALPGAETAARLHALTEWLRTHARHEGEEPLAEGIHGMLTHVVDETAAVCNGLSRELFGYALASKPPSGDATRQTQM
jgi:uncharacterized alpha-E superfamily protein